MRILTALYGCYMAKIVFYDCHTGVIWLLYGQFFVTKQVGRVCQVFCVSFEKIFWGGEPPHFYI